MVKIQCSTCQMILSLPDGKPESSYSCEYCKALVKGSKHAIETGIVIRDFTILKKADVSDGKADIFITHQISLDRLAMLELPKKNNLFNLYAFFEITQSFAQLNHKSASPVFETGQEGNFVFRSYEYNEGNFIGDLYCKISQKTAINIFLDCMDFIFYFLKTETGKYYTLLPDKIIVTPEYQVKTIPSGLDIKKKSENNVSIFKDTSKLFLKIITSAEDCKKNNLSLPVSEKLEEFLLANMNMTDNMFSEIIRGEEKNYLLLYDKLRKEVSEYY